MATETDRLWGTTTEVKEQIFDNMLGRLLPKFNTTQTITRKAIVVHRRPVPAQPPLYHANAIVELSMQHGGKFIEVVIQAPRRNSARQALDALFEASCEFGQAFTIPTANRDVQCQQKVDSQIPEGWSWVYTPRYTPSLANTAGESGGLSSTANWLSAGFGQTGGLVTLADRTVETVELESGVKADAHKAVREGVETE